MSTKFVIYFLPQALLMPNGQVVSVIACEPMRDLDYKPEPDDPIMVASFHGGDLFVPAICERTRLDADIDNPEAFDELVAGYKEAASFIDLREFSPTEALIAKAEAALVAGVSDAPGIDSTTLA